MKKHNVDKPEDHDHDPFQASVDGTPFSVILSRAAKLKSLQIAEWRSKYDSFPEFYRNTLFLRDDIKEIRTQPFQTQIDYATALNEEGREAFKRNDFLQAYTKYEISLSIFRYLHNKNCNWRSEGIKDIDIEDLSFESDNEEEKKAVQSICLKCYTNIAVTALNMQWYKVALDACNAALIIDRRNIKALFLRSKSRTVPKSSVSSDLQLALRDLGYALQIDPGNKAIRREIIKLQSDAIQKQKMYRKMFKGFFARGEDLISDETLGCNIHSSNSFGGSVRNDREFFETTRVYVELIRSTATNILSSTKPLHYIVFACIAVVCGVLYSTTL